MTRGMDLFVERMADHISFIIQNYKVNILNEVIMFSLDRLQAIEVIIMQVMWR